MGGADALRAQYAAAGQGHVFAFADALDGDSRASLLAQLRAVDPAHCNAIFAKATNPAAADTTLAPLPAASFDSLIGAPADKVAAHNAKGMELIKAGKVGVVLMAGGQGTRLGYNGPKGCYDIGLPSHKSLFQLQAERIRRLQDLAGAGVVIPWYIMALGPATKEYFEKEAYFGLDAKNVVFFEQGTLPAFTPDGKIMLETKSSVSLAPDGNGGIYAALRNSGVLDDMTARGVEYLHAYCVDNCLVRVADPVFIGYCASKGAECGAKVVRKATPDEKVGVVCLRGGKYAVVEYSEIDSAVAEQRNADGTLVYRAANIANHFYTLDFLKKIKSFEAALEYHVARKKIKHVEIPTGTPVVPTKENGIKLELFVFDVFPFVQQMAVLEVDRKDEFSPLKNAPGAKSDCPETSRADILAQHARFVDAAGGKVVQGADDKDAVPVIELSPLVTYAGEGLEAVKGATLTTPLLIATSDELKAAAKK